MRIAIQFISHIKSAEMSRSERTDSKQRVSEGELYAEFLAERKAIHDHKKNLSQQEGCDVGFEKTLVDWVANHRTKWLSKRDDTNN